MKYFHEEIATLTTAMRDLLTRMADQDRDADDARDKLRLRVVDLEIQLQKADTRTLGRSHDIDFSNLQRIKDLEAIQANQRLNTAAKERDLDRQRIKDLETQRQKLEERAEDAELTLRLQALEIEELESEARRVPVLAERMRQLERLVDPHGDIDQT